MFKVTDRQLSSRTSVAHPSCFCKPSSEVIKHQREDQGFIHVEGDFRKLGKLKSIKREMMEQMCIFKKWWNQWNDFKWIVQLLPKSVHMVFVQMFQSGADAGSFEPLDSLFRQKWCHPSDGLSCCRLIGPFKVSSLFFFDVEKIWVYYSVNLRGGWTSGI